MLINLFEYVKSGSQTKETWKLSPGNGRLQNIIAIDQDQFDLETITELVQYVIVGKQTSAFAEAKLVFCDHSGDEWTIIRQGHAGRQVLRNGRKVELELIEQSLLGALLDLDAAMKPKESLAGIIQARRLFMSENGQVEAEDIRDSLTQSKGMTRKLEQKISELLAECESIIPGFRFENQKTLHALVQRLRPLYYAWTEIQKQKKENQGDTSEDPNEVLTLEQIENFEKELSLLREIEKNSLSLLDPKESPQVITQKLQVVDTKLRGLSREIEMGHTSLKLSARINWSKVLESLSRVEVYKGLVATSEKVLRDNESFLLPGVKDHIKCSREICDRNNSITAELESCLTSLSLFEKKQEEVEAARTSRKIGKIVKNFINAEPLDSDPQTDPSGIEQARLAVDHALSKMGEIKTEIDVAANMILGSSDALYSRHEKLVQKYGQLKRHWVDLAKKCRLPQDLKIAEALKLMCSHGRMHDLLQMREGFRKTLKERSEKLHEIRELIENWQYLIGSQKDIALDNEKILLSEASSLINLRPKKERQFERYKRSADKYKALSYLQKQLNQRQANLQDKWARAFASVQSHSLAHPIQDGNWVRVFERADAIKVLHSLISDQKKNPTGDDIMQSSQNEYPINVYTIEDRQCAHKIEFLNLFGKLKSDNLIIVSCGKEYRVMLHKIGTAVVNPVNNPAPQPKTKRAPQKMPTQKSPVVEISPLDSAREEVDRIMNIFNPPSK